MVDINYYKQIISSFLKQNSNNKTALFFLDDITNDLLGQYICAMANTAALNKIPYIYAFWGIDKITKRLSNSNFNIPNKQELGQHLSTNIVFCIQEVMFDGSRIIVLEVQRAYTNTIQYDGEELLLDEEIIKKADDLSDKAKELWDIIYSNKDDDFSTEIAQKNVFANEIVKLLDCEKLFQMLQKPKPNSLLEVITELTNLRFIKEQNTGKYDITNLGALLLAKKLTMFKTVEYKAVRVLIYSGNNYTEPAHEQIGGKGYIVGFEGLIKYIYEHLPQVEYIDGALRKQKSMFPMLLIRELVANAIIHQDLKEKGAPIISIFEDHLVISNPGIPIVDKIRFIDSPPLSRNESLAAAMHRVGICEERGSGYDKVVTYIEANNLPAPEITVHEKSTSVTLRYVKSFNQLTRDELAQICYTHTCLNYIQGETTNNSSLRSRFNLDENERYKISRAFKPALEAGLIKPKDGTGLKNREYVPFWA